MRSILDRTTKAIVVSFFLTSCGGSVSFDGRGPTNADSILEAGSSEFNFNETLFPLLDQHCSGCHDSEQSPFIAISDDVVSSHKNLIDGQLIDFQNPIASRVVIKVQSNHNCWSINCSADADALKSKITEWSARNGALGGGDTPKPKTQELVIPENLPSNSNAPLYMSFPLNGINDVPPNSFIDIALYLSGGSAYVFGPLGIRSSAQLFVKKVDLQINKSFATSTYHTVNSIMQINTNVAPGFVLSSASPIVAKKNGPGLDKLRLVFDEIRLATPAEINNFAQAQRFASLLDGLDQNSCGSCHFSAIPYNGFMIPPFQRFTAPDQFKDIQQGMLNGAPRYFVDPGNPAASSLYRSVAHPPGQNSFPEIRQAMPLGANADNRASIAEIISAWITNEPD